MERNNWMQPPFCTTLMGCLQGVFDYYGMNYSPAMLYGLTGHAFFINIHREICPSGPYAWDHRFLYNLTEKMGIRITESSFLTPDTPKEICAEAVDRLSVSLEGNNPCMITCLEHQLVKEKRDGEILLFRPWEEEIESQFSFLDSDNLSPCLEKAGFLSIGYFEKSDVQDNLGKTVHRALLQAEDLFKNPEKYQHEGYQSGFGAYEYWISALQKEKYDEHGHWWNGMVWAECRRRGAEFFEELIDRKANLDETALKSLAGVYRIISERLDEAKGKELEREKKIILLTEALEMEYEANFLIENMLHP